MLFQELFAPRFLVFLFFLQLPIVRAFAQLCRRHTMRTRGLIRSIFQAVEESIKGADTRRVMRGKAHQQSQPGTAAQVLGEDGERFRA